MAVLIRMDQLAALRKSLQRAIPVNVVLGLAALAVASNSGHARLGLAWFLVSSLVNLMRFALCRAPVACNGQPGWPVARHLALHRFAAFVSGSVWAGLAILSNGFSAPESIFYVTVLSGITAGSVTYGTSYWPVPVLFISPPLAAVIACLALGHSLEAILLSATITIYLVALVLAAREADASFQLRCRLTHEAREMARSLQEANDRSMASAREMLHRATHDTLTGLLNRGGFLQCLESVLARNSGPVCLMCLDLDDFKTVNDVFGHATGDRVLQKVARRLHEVTPPSTHVARLGGDEFALIIEACPSSGEQAMNAMAQRLLDVISEPFTTFESSRVSSSIGIHVASGGGVGEMLAKADAALYAAKGAGRNKAQLFDEALQRRVDLERDIERELPVALRDGQVEIWFQPIFDAQGGVDTLEALLRWRHPRHGQVDPAVVVAVAARSGQSEALFRHVAGLGCTMMTRLAERGHAHIRVALNVSPREAAKVPIDAILLDLLARHGVEAGRLEIEITEETALDRAIIAERLQPLEAAGARIVIDDFGVGYASLDAVRHIAVSRLKIDRSYSAELQRGSRAHRLLKAIVALGRSLQMEVVAEGVESEATRLILIELGCAYLQGYHLGRPMPGDEFLESLGSGLAAQ